MKALLAGSFDPFTVGHYDIAVRGLSLFGSLLIGIGINCNKKCLWTPEERLIAISKRFEDLPQVEVKIYSGLTIDFAKENNVNVLLRGVRNMIDFEYERNLADANKDISGIETALLFADPRFAFISSSMVRELWSYGHEVKEYLGAPFEIPVHEKNINAIKN